MEKRGYFKNKTSSKSVKRTNVKQKSIYAINFTIIIVILVSMTTFQSCKVSKSPVVTNYSSEENSNPNIIFLSCSLEYDSIQQSYTMELISKQVIDGKLKNTVVRSEEQEKGDFKYRILDQNSQLISQKYMPCPLDKNIEYVNEQGYLQRKDVRLNSAEVFLRLQLTPDMYYISFDKQDKQLLLINLK